MATSKSVTVYWRGN